MRICYVINGLNGGGAALPLPEVLSLMQRAGHQVSLVALARQDGRSEARLREAGIAYRILGPERIGFRSLVRLLRLLRNERPDLIWTSLTGASFLGQLCGKWLKIPVVSWQHNAYLKAGNRLLLRSTRTIPALWVADSEAVREFAIGQLGVEASRLHIWPLFIAEMRPAARPWPGTGLFRMGTLGRLHPNKGYDVLIRALARLQRCEPQLAARLDFCIAGSGDERAALQQLAADLGVRCLRFAGFIDDTTSFLAGLHAYVQTSRNEGLCLAAHEAMLAALPVIATPVGQLAHSIVHGHSGRLCRVGNVEQLAYALAETIADPAGSAAMGLNARRRAFELFGRARFEQQGNAILQKLSPVSD